MKEEDLSRDLAKLLGERVTTSQFERSFYTSDLLPLRKEFKRLFKTMPSAVAKPETAEEVSAVVSYCSRHNIPIVPRGGGSSGLLGSVPKRGGVVLDLLDLSRVVEVDRERETVTAEAGITWWELDRRLNGHGFAVRSYPSSAKSATVGGWIMTSGCGIGSLRYGPVFDQLLSAQIVLPDGDIKEYNCGEGLEWFFETEGILGIVTRVVLKVRPIPESTFHHLIYFDDIENLFEVLKPLANMIPCPYSIEIHDHKYLDLLRASGYQVADFSLGSGILLATWDGKREEIEQARDGIRRLIGSYSGTEREGAEHEWEQRFNILRIKRAVPTIIPASVIVPLDSMKQFYSALERLGKRTIGLVGHVISKSECDLLPMLATDEKRSIEYTFSLHTPRDISNLALSLGGKPAGGLGVWNTPYRKRVLTEKKIEEIRKRKRELDPKGILNPGMWLEPPLFLRPKVYQPTMQVISILDRIFPAGVGRAEEGGLAKEIASCVQCGYCMKACPTNLGWVSSTPRGRILKAKGLFGDQPLKKEGITQEYIDRVFQCTLCGRCRVDCTVEIKSPQMWLDLRSYLLKSGFEIESLEGLTKVIKENNNIVAKPNDQRANWTKKSKLEYLNEKRGGEVVYFVGCVTSFFAMTQPVAGAFAQILNSAGVDYTILGGEEWCCGFPLIAGGMGERAEKYIKHNIDRVRETGAKSLVMTCPGCYMVWKHEYHDVIQERHPFDVFHSTEFIAKLIEEGKIVLGGLEDSVTYHDPCDLGRNGGIFGEPRYILGKIPGLNFKELEDNRQYCNCCGSGGDLLVTNQDLSLAIAGRKVEEVLNTGAETLVTACPACIRAISMAKTREKANFDVLDITQLVRKSMGS